METPSENTTQPESMEDQPIAAETGVVEPASAELTAVETAAIEPPSPKKKVWIGIAILAAVLVLAGTAFLGARLLAPQGQVRGGPGGGAGPRISMRQAGGGGMAAETSLNVQNAPEIPQRAPDMNGAVTEVKNNSLMVSDVESVMVRMDENGQSDTDIEYRGTAAEVVVTKETQIYFDTTFQNMDPMKDVPKEGETILQTVEPASFSEIGPQSMVSVWGYKRGDRLMAEVILVNQMMGMGKK